MGGFSSSTILCFLCKLVVHQFAITVDGPIYAIRWKIRAGYPVRWMILSAVMFLMAACYLIAGPDWNAMIDTRTLRLRALGTVVNQFLAFRKPPDPYDDLWRNTGWDSQPDFEEWIFDHEHRVMDKMGFGHEYLEWYGSEIETILGVTRMSLGVPTKGHANDVIPIWQCKLSAFSVEHETIDVLMDTGASHSFTCSKDDFVSEIQPCSMDIGGFTGDEAAAQGKGMVLWYIKDEKGNQHALTTEAYYVPRGTRRLFSPQRHFQDWEQRTRLTSPGKFAVSARQAHYTDNEGWTLRWTIRDLPVVLGTQHREKLVRFEVDLRANNVLNEDNPNLSTSQKELLLWHQRLGHVGFGWLQRLMRHRTGTNDGEGYEIPPCIPTTHPNTRCCQAPVCATCQYGQQRRRGDGTRIEKRRQDLVMALQRDHLQPGDCVSIDHYESSVRGRLPNTQGREAWHRRYCGGTIFVDHATGYTRCFHQSSLTAGDTLRSKRRFEQDARGHNVRVKKYHGDNGVFTAKEFQDELAALGQLMTYSGVGAHHQNGVAERAIMTIFYRARSMLLHASIHWPEATSEALWPFAVDYAVHLWNHSEGITSGMSPAEMFAGVKTNCSMLRSSRVWGCPVYVLEPKLQDGHKLPKWKPRSRRGQFLGASSQHSRHIGLIRNLRTGNVTPQFHVVYDERFHTVAGADQPIAADTWFTLFTYARDYHLYEDDIPPDLHDHWMEGPLGPGVGPQLPIPVGPVPFAQPNPMPPPGAPAVVGEQPPNPNPNPNPEDNNPNENQNPNNNPQHLEQDDTIVFEPDDDHDNEQQWQLFEDYGLDQDDPSTEGDSSTEGDADLPIAQRLNRPNRGQTNRYNDYVTHVAEMHYGDGFLAAMEWDSMPMSSQAKALALFSELHRDYDLPDEEPAMTPFALAVKANDEDTPNFNQAMNGPDAEGYRDAMDKEIDELAKKEAWTLVDIAEAQKAGTTIIGTTWAFKRKRYPDGSVKKLKARICVRGDQQVKGIDVFDTFAPVVQWAVVRLVLTMSIGLGLETIQVDYANAFVQAKLDKPVYVQCPRNYEVPGKVLRLNRNLYGMRESPLNWFRTLSAGLERIGLRPCPSEPCLFTKKGILVIVYVDDCIFVGRDKKKIRAEIDKLKKDFHLDEEEDMAGFLGVQIEDLPDGGKMLTQTGLTDRIIQALKLTDANTKETPAEYGALDKDKNGTPFDHAWNYRSVLGMMSYLATNARCDIAFAVNQCARFCANPTMKHATAMKRIGKYLKKTKKKGMIMKPSKDLTLDLYVDADFAGLWSYEDPHDPSCVKSRTGYVITLGDVPIVWKSKLQEQVALSTMEAEYIAASVAMRELLPMRRILTYICDELDIERPKESTISTVWEDNSAALSVMQAPLPKITPRSKHFAVKLHWFKSHLGEAGGNKIFAKKIDTKDQKADIFTKGLRTDDFQRIRRFLLGW